MGLLVFVLLVLVVLALACYCVTLLPAIEPPFKQLITIVLVIIAIVAIVSRAGLVAI